MELSDITAVLPLKHHHPRLLRAAIESMFAQTDAHWRLLVVVEPEDLTVFTAELSEALRDPRVRLIPNRHHRYAGAFNTGVEAAESEFVAILLSDDMWASNAVETLRASIQAHPEVDFFHSGRRIVDDEGRPVGSMIDPVESFVASDFIWRSMVKHLLCWRRSKALSVGGMDEAITTAGPDDYDFPWTMFEQGATFRAVPHYLYIYRDHRAGFRNTTHLPRSIHLRNLRYILRKHGVPRLLIWRRLRAAKGGYLRQCLYRNRLDRWLKQRFGPDPSSGWRLDFNR